MTKPDIILVANSPGELSALVEPMVKILSTKNYRIILVLTPCQYASGKEVEYASKIPGISEIISAEKWQKWVFLNQKPRGIKFSPKGVVLFLGGDLAYAVILAKKLKYPACAYLNERIAWRNFFKKFFVRDQAAYDKFSKAASPRKLKLVGDLMVDSVAHQKKWEPEEKVITFMPGSRQWEINYMTPFYQEVLALIKKEEKEAKFQIVSSPFIPAKPLEGAKIIDFEKVHNSEIVITIPGTNTARLAARGIPMIMVFPLNHPEVIPLEGLAELVGRVPFVGKAFKRWLAKNINKKTRFFALPNQKAQKEIVPEIRGEVDPFSVALKVLSLLKEKEKRKRMSLELTQAMGKPGAAKKIVEELDELLSSPA